MAVAPMTEPHQYLLAYAITPRSPTQSVLLPRLHATSILISIPLLLKPLPIPAPSRIKLLPILIPHLPTTLPAPILPPLRKPLIQIRPYNPLIQLRPANVLQAVQRIFMRVVLDEAKTAGGFVEAVQAHDEAFDLAGFGEEFVDLLFGCVEGEVPDVEGCCVGEFFFEGGRGGAFVGVGGGVVGSFALFVLPYVVRGIK